VAPERDEGDMIRPSGLDDMKKELIYAKGFVADQIHQCIRDLETKEQTLFQCVFESFQFETAKCETTTRKSLEDEEIRVICQPKEATERPCLKRAREQNRQLVFRMENGNLRKVNPSRD
jgi:hypothetical protein